MLWLLRLPSSITSIPELVEELPLSTLWGNALAN